MSDFQLMIIFYNKRGFILQFQKEFSNVCCDVVVLKYFFEFIYVLIRESDFIRFIFDNNNVVKEEIVVCVCIYLMLDYVINFVLKNGLFEDSDILVLLVEEFFNLVNIIDE